MKIAGTQFASHHERLLVVGCSDAAVPWLFVLTFTFALILLLVRVVLLMLFMAVVGTDPASLRVRLPLGVCIGCSFATPMRFRLAAGFLFPWFKV